MLLLEQKNDIVARSVDYMGRNNMTQADLCRLTGINPGYMSNMLRNNYEVEVKEKMVPIGDQWFAMLSAALGFSLKKQYWLTVRTPEFEQMLHELSAAKNDSRVITLITDTGYGKTFCIDKFTNLNPLHTYKITVNSMFKLRDIINDLADVVGTPIKYSAVDTLRTVALKMRQLKMMGHQPLIIIDEAENLKLPVIQMLKGLYDTVHGYASIVLIGTHQLLDLMEKLNRTNRNGAPQFYRRIKAGIKVIPSVKNFTRFYEKHKVEDKGLRKLLDRICNNYGELHDYLEPFLKECDVQEQTVSENFFRIIYNMPKAA